MVKIKVKKLHIDAVMPKFMNKGDAGADLTATSIEIKDNIITYGTGISVEIPEGYCMKIYPRSSIYKTYLSLCNGVAVVDSKYRGEIFLKFKINSGVLYEKYSEIRVYKTGDRIGQAIIEKLVPTEYIEVDELDMTDDRKGGFGSTNV